MAVGSAVIVVAFLLGALVFVGQSGFFGYEDTAMTEAKRVSAHAAEGCLRHALLYLSDGSYEGGETIALSEYSCNILPILFGTSTITIRARSEVRGSRTNLELVVDSYTLKRISFTEKNSF